jgi:hypothetical protein
MVAELTQQKNLQRVLSQFGTLNRAKTLIISLVHCPSGMCQPLYMKPTLFSKLPTLTE